MKKIEELTETEAREILTFVFPKEDYWFKELSMNPKINEDGSQQVTFGFRSIIGVLYHNGQDNCILHFDDTKVVLWLYKHGYDIGELLEANKHLSQMEMNFENFAFAIEYIKIKQERLTDENRDKFTIDYILKEYERAAERYYYIDYE